MLINTHILTKFERMGYISRNLEPMLQRTLERGKSVLLLGPRQTGKTTLLNRLPWDLTLSLVPPKVRIRYEKDPSLLGGEVEALGNSMDRVPRVFLDEVQKVPDLMDVIQDLIDRKQALFVLTGSSARKLKRGKSVNLLPGRLAAFRLDPLCMDELPSRPELDELLLDGTLPGILSVPNPKDRELDLNSYVTTYLEEEIREEALVRNVGRFARFLEMAAIESGNPVNFSRISQDIGVAHTTVAAYYEILEDCLIAERVEPLAHGPTRRRLARTPRYLLFDMGVRRICAREGRRLPATHMGKLFEQFTGLELIRMARRQSPDTRVRYWRDWDGREVDWVLESPEEITPIEVKWTDAPSRKDCRNLEAFMDLYPRAKRGFIVCRTPKRIQLGKRIQALPWWELKQFFLP